MIIDFSFVLVVLALVTGVVYAVDKFALRARRAAAGVKVEPWYVDYSRSFFPVILVVLVLRSFLYEPFRIPSDSMMPTLVEGDFIFVNKWRYGLRLPVANWKFVEIGDPARGDVIVFRKPSEPSVVFIKRLVGLPGDRITVTEQGVLVNGQPAPLMQVGLYRGPKEEQYPFTMVLTEDLPGKQHRLMLDPARPSAPGEWVVPEGKYFFMGDNRNNSRDSRFPEVGFVPAENLIGKAVSIWLSFNPGQGSFLLWDRMGTSIE
ncbi:MAG: signal peptidase I [Steroidobacteraceae bacterium]|nr:signal peptidase I [Steroidobacteraceae bacterium]MCC7197925.1 signal peptidase I [Gammaproteobacteria bacterium]